MAQRMLSAAFSCTILLLLPSIFTLAVPRGIFGAVFTSPLGLLPGALPLPPIRLFPDPFGHEQSSVLPLPGRPGDPARAHGGAGIVPVGVPGVAQPGPAPAPAAPGLGRALGTRGVGAGFLVARGLVGKPGKEERW